MNAQQENGKNGEPRLEDYPHYDQWAAAHNEWYAHQPRASYVPPPPQWEDEVAPCLYEEDYYEEQELESLERTAAYAGEIDTAILTEGDRATLYELRHKHPMLADKWWRFRRSMPLPGDYPQFENFVDARAKWRSYGAHSTVFNTDDVKNTFRVWADVWMRALLVPAEWAAMDDAEREHLPEAGSEEESEWLESVDKLYMEIDERRAARGLDPL